MKLTWFLYLDIK